MITKNCILKAVEIGGIESWKYIKERLEVGQVFYCIDIGEIEFCGFINEDAGFGVPIFKSRAGYSSYDYFYREIIIGDSLFLNPIDCRRAKEKRDISMVLKRSDDSLATSFCALSLVKELITVEVNYADESIHSKILNVKDVFIGDNENLIISVDDF